MASIAAAAVNRSRRRSASEVVLLVLGIVWNSLVVGEGTLPKRCQEITIPMCRGIGYNLTYMPNQFSHETQEEAGLEVHQFWPLVEIQCSPDLRFFLCSTYAPICMTNYQKPLPACRSVCERAKAGCSPLMRQYGFAWPDRLGCSDLPEYGDKHRLCMDFNHSAAAAVAAGEGSVAGGRGSFRPRVPVQVVSTSLRSRTRSDVDCECRCRFPYVPITNQTMRYYDDHEGFMTSEQVDCVASCDGAFFGGEERRFARFWIGLWATMCCLSTTLTVLTFLVDRQRFRYPERSIIFLSACYAVVSIGYIVPLVDGDRVIACSDPGEDQSYEDGPLQRTVRRQDAIESIGCVSVFLAVYFFGMAANIWWVILSLTWFLTAGLKWSQEAIASYSHYFHLAAWIIPSAKTVAALSLSVVDGDPLSGICYVGNHSVNSLTGFVLVPLGLYLLVGTSFLIAGFVSLFRIRSVIKQQRQAKTDKLDHFMIRIGLASVLYTVPATTVVSCYIYERRFRSDWEQAILCPCLRSSINSSISGASSSPHPEFSIFVLKYFMSIVVGISSGFWIWSRKTLESWSSCYRRLFCPCRKSARQLNEMVHVANDDELLIQAKYIIGSPTLLSRDRSKTMSLSHV